MAERTVHVSLVWLRRVADARDVPFERAGNAVNIDAAIVVNRATHPPARRVKRAFIVALGFAAVLAHAQVFKWVDEKGRTHYGERPPEGVKSSEVAKPTPPSEPGRVKEPDWKNKAREVTKERRERENKESQDADREARTVAERQQRCRDARIALDRLSNVQRLYKYDAKGERVYMTDADRDAERVVANREAGESCDSR